MGDVVNLRVRRKRQIRETAEKSAAQNRTLFGRSKAGREEQQRREAQAALHLDQHKLPDRPDDIL